MNFDEIFLAHSTTFIFFFIGFVIFPHWLRHSQGREMLTVSTHPTVITVSILHKMLRWKPKGIQESQKPLTGLSHEIYCLGNWCEMTFESNSFLWALCNANTMLSVMKNYLLATCIALGVFSIFCSRRTNNGQAVTEVKLECAPNEDTINQNEK